MGLGRRSYGYTSKKFRDSEEFAEDLAIEKMLKCWVPITVETVRRKALPRQLRLADPPSACSVRTQPRRSPKRVASLERHRRNRRTATHLAHWVVRRRLRSHNRLEEASSPALEAEAHNKQAVGSLAPLIQAHHKRNNNLELQVALSFLKLGGRRRRLAVDY